VVLRESSKLLQQKRERPKINNVIDKEVSSSLVKDPE
jgi:hypothetical protein